jgi:hypothetical protein
MRPTGVVRLPPSTGHCVDGYDNELVDIVGSLLCRWW